MRNRFVVIVFQCNVLLANNLCSCVSRWLFRVLVVGAVFYKVPICYRHTLLLLLIFYVL
jgi:hypothetical protein